MTLAGLRPGEKLFEEKLMAEEKYRYLQNIPQPDDNFWSILKELLAEKEIIEKHQSMRLIMQWFVFVVLMHLL